MVTNVGRIMDKATLSQREKGEDMRYILQVFVAAFLFTLVVGNSTIPAQTPGILHGGISVLSSQDASCCVGLTGNIDNDPDDLVDVGDLTALIDHLFITYREPECIWEANIDGDEDGIIDIGDLTALINFMFIGFSPPAPCQSNGSGPTGVLIEYTGCKGFEGAAAAVDTTSDQDCIEYHYDGESVLSIKHINAGFNCCSDITAAISIEGNIITIEELEFGEMCYCLCLFDVYYEISNLPSGEYRISVIEPYLSGGDEELDFTVDLLSSPSGIHCVDRTTYPWGQ